MTFSTFSDNPARTLLALLLAVGVSLLATRARALTTSGAIAATIVGTLTVTGSGWWCGLVLILYFISSSALSRVAPDASTSIRQARGNQRDHVQVLANGGFSAFFSLIAFLTETRGWIIAALAAIAVATADTWATEFGRITQAMPRSILTGQQVPAGTSGAISLPGTCASVVGSLFIAGAAALGFGPGWIEPYASTGLSISLIFLGGSVGSLLDSLLGATVQATYYCEHCAEATEFAEHGCGNTARLVSGYRWISNDVVNLASIGIPATLAGVVQTIVG